MARRTAVVACQPLVKERRVVPQRYDDEVAGLAKALGHPLRVAIVRMLRAQGACVCGDIVEQLPRAQATVSQHLKLLREAGWISGTVDGPRICYGLKAKVYERFRQLVSAL